MERNNAETADSVGTPLLETGVVAQPIVNATADVPHLMSEEAGSSTTTHER